MTTSPDLSPVRLRPLRPNKWPSVARWIRKRCCYLSDFARRSPATATRVLLIRRTPYILTFRPPLCIFLNPTEVFNAHRQDMVLRFSPIHF
jgi:hypothetical protein